MSRFKVGDTAHYLNGKGTVDFVEDGYIVIVTDAGVEIDFEDELKLYTDDDIKTMHEERMAEYKRDKEERAKAAGPNVGMHLYTKQHGDDKVAAQALVTIAKVHEPLLSLVTDVDGDLNKIKMLSEKTKVPIVVFLTFSNDEISMKKVLVQIIISGLAGGNEVMMDMLLAKAKAAIAAYENQ